jgi:hypothetical protein
VNQVPSADALIDEIISLLDSFLRAADALTGAINNRNAVAMCEAVERLGRARKQALGLVGLEPSLADLSG